MAVTLQQIADAAGVSRATVDRALKNRGRVNQDVASRIKQLAEEMGYHPNQAGRVLALAKNPIKIGIIIQSVETTFMQQLIEGVKRTKKEVQRNGVCVEVRYINGVNAQQVIDYMEEFKRLGVKGIALLPAEDERIKTEIDKLVEVDNIPVITFNADISASKRLCFIGQDNKKAGQVAAGLMAECIPPLGQVGIIAGPASHPGHNSRVKGFKEILGHSRPDINIINTWHAEKNHESAWVTEEVLSKYPDIKGLFVGTAALDGICHTIKKHGVDDKIKIIANDVVDENIEKLEAGLINFLIGQDAETQGSEPLRLLYHMLVEEIKPKKDRYYTPVIIKNRYNI